MALDVLGFDSAAVYDVDAPDISSLLPISGLVLERIVQLNDAAVTRFEFDNVRNLLLSSFTVEATE